MMYGCLDFGAAFVTVNAMKVKQLLNHKLHVHSERKY